MILPDKKDSVHRAWLYRTLSHIFDNSFLAGVLAFKGGTAAAMLGYLDRFSLDLDFDFLGESGDIPRARQHMEKIFSLTELTVRDKSAVIPHYILKYPSANDARNTIKIDMALPPPAANSYEPKRFIEIDRIILCQTRDTMVANKLVAVMDRYRKTGKVAGRDMYDVHQFFLKGFSYNEGVIRELSGKEPRAFFSDLIEFVERHITQQVIDQDLNRLLPPEQFKRMRKILKQEALALLRGELRLLSSSPQARGRS